jgi:hypothetical protein
MVDPSEPRHALPNRAAPRPSGRGDATPSSDAGTDDRGANSEYAEPTAQYHGHRAAKARADPPRCGNDAVPTDEDLRRAGAKLATGPTDADHRRTAQSPRSTSASPVVPQAPWKRSKPRQAFTGDIAAAELRKQPVLAPDRPSEPPSPVSPSPKFASAGRFLGVVVIAAAGFIGYQWGSAPPAATSQRQFTPPSNRDDLASEQSVSGDLNGPSLDSKSPAVRPAANVAPPASPSARPASLVNPRPDRPVAARTDATEADAPPQGKLAESGTSALQEPAPATLREDRERALRLKQRGDEQLAQGLMAPARMLYEKAADLGLADAALALAVMYDENAPAHSNLRGLGSDPKAAAHWYERARLLAARDAADRQVQTVGGN